MCQLVQDGVQTVKSHGIQNRKMNDDLLSKVIDLNFKFYGFIVSGSERSLMNINKQL